jgi:hypothetical protein
MKDHLKNGAYVSKLSFCGFNVCMRRINDGVFPTR